jgi:hypothetical protein
MSMPSRTPPNATEPTVDPLSELIDFVSGEGQSAPSKGCRERPAEIGSSQAQDHFTSEMVATLKEVVAALDSPEMATFFARAYAQGNTYTGPQINMDRLRTPIAKAKERGVIPKRAA